MSLLYSTVHRFLTLNLQNTFFFVIFVFLFVFLLRRLVSGGLSPLCSDFSETILLVTACSWKLFWSWWLRIEVSDCEAGSWWVSLFVGLCSLLLFLQFYLTVCRQQHWFYFGSINIPGPAQPPILNYSMYLNHIILFILDRNPYRYLGFVQSVHRVVITIYLQKLFASDFHWNQDISSV